MAYRRTREQDAEESAEVEVLLAQAKRHEELGRKIKASLSRLEAIGSDLEEAAGPVYNDTGTLQTTTQNADRLLEAITKTQSPLEGRAEDERMVREGPEAVGLPNYVACLRRVERKYDQLIRSSVRANQDAGQEMSQLLNFGAKRLQELFEDTLKAASVPVEPLEFITRKRPFPTFSQGTLAPLAEVRAFFASTQSNNATIAIQNYADIRGRYLQGSLTNLASATKTTAKRQNAEDFYRKDTCAINTYATGIVLSFDAEWSNIRSIFGSSDHGRVLEMATGKPLAELAQVLKDLCGQIKANINTDCFLAYDVIGVINDLAFEMDKRTGQLKQNIFGTVKPVRDIAKQSLHDLIDDVHQRVNALGYLPMDGAALPLTALITARLQAMTEYRAPLGSIMSSVGDGNWTSSGNISSSSVPTLKSFDVNPNTDSLLAHYVDDTIDALFRDFESKSRNIHKQKHVTGVFLLNNLVVAERMIRSSGLAPYFPNGQSPRLESWKAKATKSTMNPWDDLIRTTLMDQQNTSRDKRGNRPPSGAGPGENASLVKNLSSKERDAIKDKFKSFNIRFDDLCAKHRELIPAMEREVRPMLAKEIHRSLENMYKRFYDRYHEIDKGKGKYVKYDPTTLAGQLTSLA